MSKVLANYHIVFCTKARKNTIPLEHAEHLYRFIWKELDKRRCRLLRIGGIQNHIHMLIELHPTLALSNLIRDIKANSSSWMKGDIRFGKFEGWGSDYYAATISHSEKDKVIEYIKSQHEHHLGTSFDNELIKLHQLFGLEYDDRELR